VIIMSTRQTQFFMRPPEFADFVKEIEEVCGTTLMKDRRDGVIHVGTIADAMALLAKNPVSREFYLAEFVPSPLPAHKGFAPGREGWVGLDAPREDGNRLLMGELGSRSDWFEGGFRHDSPVAHHLYGRVLKILKRRLKFPTWMVNIRPDAGPPRSYKSIGFSPGAEAWFDEGKELWHEGVANQRYMPREGPPPGGAH
jgi:hypothetical protein